LTSNKGVIIATLFVGVLSAAVALFIHFDGPSEGLMTKDTKNEQANNDEKKVEPTPSLNFAKVFVTPVDTEMPSSFYMEISNTGSAPAKDFKINIDFGESKSEKCEFLPSEIVKNKTDEASVIKSISISELPKKQSLYVVCATNSPLFKSITVGGGNVEYDKQLTFEGYKEQLNGESISFYEGLLRTILGALAGIFLFYLFFRLMGTL
jgi:hypothetical protein